MVKYWTAGNPTSAVICYSNSTCTCNAFSALTLLVGRQEGHPACKKTEWWGAGVVICLERGAELHMAQRMPLPLTISCFGKIQIGFTFLVPAHLGCPGKGPLNGCCCCTCTCNIEVSQPLFLRLHQPLLHLCKRLAA